MKPSTSQLMAAALLLTLSLVITANTPVITVVHHAAVYTLNDKQPTAEAFAYRDDGNITAVGSNEQLLSEYESNATLIDAKGTVVLPGFQDTHVHVPEAGINELLCLLPADEPLAAYEDLIADCAMEQVDADWVRGAGVSLFNFRDSAELPIELLDRAVPDRPALVLDDLGHAVWANSLALEKAGIVEKHTQPLRRCSAS